MSRRPRAGVVHGTVGGSLDTEASFAVTAEAARVGSEGEKRVAAALNALAQRHPVAVMHDLDIPGTPANIDHLIVWGTTVLLVDAKVWKPMRYRTVGDRAYRGGPGFPLSLVRKGEPCLDPRTGKDFIMKQTMPMAVDRLSAYLDQQAVSFTMAQPVLVVCPSSPRRADELNLRKLRVPGAITLPERVAMKRIERQTRGCWGYDPVLVGALRPLVRSSGQHAAPVRRTRSTVPSAPDARPQPADPDAGW